jgi:hypothetical protein
MDPISAVSGLLNTILGRVLPDPAAKLAAQQATAQMVMTGELQQLTAQAGVITAEANSANKLASSWRPCLMYVFMAILVNNYILAPYLQAIFHVGLTLPIPTDMWSLLRLGVGGYVVSRGVEKVMTPQPGTGVSPVSHAATSVANMVSTFKGN